MSMFVCPAAPNMTCMQGCCCAICDDNKRNRCNDVCGFWKKGQANVRENLINKSKVILDNLKEQYPDFRTMTLEQIADYHVELKSRGQ